MVVTIAGDIAGGDSGRNDEATAALVQSIDPDVALTAGDNAYESGTLSEYTSQYAPSWGRFKARTRPVPGNHEYDSANAQGYYDYFNGAGHADGPAGPRGKGYYSFDAGAWHLIALNPHVSASAGSPQEQWLRRDLAAHSGHCTLAYWHEPRFTSGAEHSDDTSVAPFWKDLYAAHADLVVNGHNHQYERFAPQDPSGKADATGGIREFVVGTGGAGLYPFATPQPNSRVRDDTSHGVLKLTLHRGSYDWRFVPIAGDTFTDSGSGRCHHPSSAAAHRYPMRGVFFRQSNGGFSVQLAHGFNLVDSTPGELGGLPAGIKGLTWVGNYNRATCRWETTDAQLAGAVRAHVGDPKVGVWFISDEPWQGGTPHCPAAPAQHRARSDLIHSIDPNAKTLIVLDGNSDRESVDQLPAWKGTADYVGVNAYICWHGQPCHYEWIDKLGHAAAAAGLPLWGVIQAFGDTPGGGESMCTTMNGCGIARLPTPAELHEEFVHWRATSMLSYLVFSWRWPADTPSLWLEHHPELQDQLRTEAGS